MAKAIEFKSGKIRKNAKKQIKALLEMATDIKLETQSMGMDDCHRSNGKVTKTAADVLAWMADDWNYSDCRVWLTCDENGNPVKLEIGGKYHFSDEFTITFEPKADDLLPAEEKAEIEALLDGEKPRATYAQVVAALAEGYLSPLNHDRKELSEYERHMRDEKARNGKTPAEVAAEEKRAAAATSNVVEINPHRIVKVQVKLAEGLELSERQGVFMELDEYERIAGIIARRENETEAYCKVWVSVHTAGGGTHELRHDINLNNQSLGAYWNRIVAHYTGTQSKHVH